MTRVEVETDIAYPADNPLPHLEAKAPIWASATGLRRANKATLVYKRQSHGEYCFAGKDLRIYAPNPTPDSFPFVYNEQPGGQVTTPATRGSRAHAPTDAPYHKGLKHLH